MIENQEEGESSNDTNNETKIYIDILRDIPETDALNRYLYVAFDSWFNLIGTSTNPSKLRKSIITWVMIDIIL